MSKKLNWICFSMRVRLSEALLFLFIGVLVFNMGSIGQKSGFDNSSMWVSTPLAHACSFLPTSTKTSAAPSPRIGAIMFYDPVNQRVLLFGGGSEKTGTPVLFNDMWRYDYNSDAWTEVKMKNTPGGIYDFPAVYDPVRERLLIRDDPGSLWAFNVKDDTWIKLESSAGATPWRMESPFVYDTRYGKILLFSGMTGDPSGDRLPNDTWAYDPVSNQWRKMSPDNPPLGRYSHVFVYDPVRKRAIMVGGYVAANTPNPAGTPENVWTYDYQTDAWSQIDGSAIPMRKYSAFSMNTDTGELTIFGGVYPGAPKENLYPSDTWIFGEKEWRQLKSGTSPPGRYTASMVYDPVNKVTLLFGGSSAQDDKIIEYNDLWALDASGGWKQLQGTGTPPPPHIEPPKTDTSSVPGYPVASILCAILIFIISMRARRANVQVF